MARFARRVVTNHVHMLSNVTCGHKTMWHGLVWQCTLHDTETFVFVCSRVCLWACLVRRGGGGGGDARMSDGTQPNYGSTAGYDATYGRGPDTTV